MSGFDGFSRAAKLYADNAGIVDAVQKVFNREVAEYLDTFTNCVGMEVSPKSLRVLPATAYRYWWIDYEDRHRNSLLHLWLKQRNRKSYPPAY